MIFVWCVIVNLNDLTSRYLGPDSNTSESVGTVKGVLTEPGNQAGRNVGASDEQPRYEVK